MPYNRTMPNARARTLSGSPRLAPIGSPKMPVHRLTRSSRDYWNRSVSTFARTRYGDKRPKPLGVQQYWNAGVLTAYGNLPEARLQLGDLFNDVMGAIVPGWDQRPQELKNLRVNLDPQKVFETASKILPPKQSQAAIEAMQRAGVQLDYKGMPVTPNAVWAAYQAGGVGAAVSAVPTWVWIAGAGGVILLFAMRR